jgi:Ca-activated chloride channel family protein
VKLLFPWGLLLGLPVLLAALAAWRRRPPALLIPDARGLPPSRRAARRYRVPLLLETLAGLLLAAAMARPQWLRTANPEERQAVDVMLVLDISGSMDAVDIPAGLEPQAAAGRPSRLLCAQRELERFMQARPQDRFGLVVFARRPYPACPLTFDHDLLRARLADLRTDLLDDGTGLTAAIALGAVHVKTSPSPHRVMILLTDGRDNVPAEQTPAAAAQLAARSGVTIHVVGIGSANAVLPVTTLAGSRYRPVETAIDETRLQAIATEGAGVFVRADAPETFAAAVSRIESTEKARIVRPVRQRRTELFPLFGAASLLSLTAAFVVARTAGATLP